MTSPVNKTFILLVRKLGKKKEKSSSYSLTLGRSSKKVEVLPGNLLRCVDDKTKGHIFLLVLVTLDAEPVEIEIIPGEAEEIPTETVELLYPIANCGDRLRVYNDRSWLKEGMTTRLGDSVYVKMKIDGSELPGVVRYKGNIKDLRGIYFGVELINDQGRGTSNGSANGYQYFKCAQDTGVFCSLNKIRKRRESFGQSELSKAEGNQYNNRPSSQTETKIKGCNLVIGDRIVWVKDTGEAEDGTVKWIGTLPDSKLKDITVGVEFDHPVGSGTGKYSEHRLFYAKQNHASLIPVMGLIKADEYYPDKNTDKNCDGDSGLFTESSSRLQTNDYRRYPGENSDNYSKTLDRPIKIPSKDDHAVRKEHYNSHDMVHLSSLPLHQFDEKDYRGRGGKENGVSVNKTERDYFGKKYTDPKVSEGYFKEGMNPMYELSKLENEENEVISSRSKVSPSSNELSIGWRVAVPIKQTMIYGVIRWMGKHDGKDTAGIETDEEIAAGTDGTFMGKKYFDCAPKHAFFVPLDKCKKDKRFCMGNNKQTHNKNGFGSLETPDITGDISPPTSLNNLQDLDKVCGKNKGIQGHHNSCYLDSMLFGMFYFTTVFDSILYRRKEQSDIAPYETVQKVLKEGIVNPLRRNHYVRADKVMKLRELLDKHSSIPGMMNEEKDPEEFLQALLCHVMKADPFLHLSSGEHTYFYQLFMERDDCLLLPTTQRLLEISCLQCGVKLKEVPSCLIIQMPRFGKDYKMYGRIIPSLELDITDILENSPRECVICGHLAEYECKECYQVMGAPGLNSTAFCEQCSARNHKHPTRKNHNVDRIEVPMEYIDYISEQSEGGKEPEYTVPREKMELFAVVCIQTSHYVSFVKCGSGKDAQWVFFDSMADRMGEQTGYNIPQVTPVPDLISWLSETKFEELATVSDDKIFPEHMRRLLSDAYMCMYQSPDVMKFR